MKQNHGAEVNENDNNKNASQSILNFPRTLRSCKKPSSGLVTINWQGLSRVETCFEH